MPGFDHLRFQKHWHLTEDTLYRLGQCDALVQTIANMPLRPQEHRDLLTVSLRRGAQATTAIEGNTLTDKEIKEVDEGRSLPPSREYQQIEVRNILDAMNQLLQEIAGDQKKQRVTPELIRSLHVRVGRDLGQQFDAIPGQYRQDERRVGPYRCPSHQDVPRLVDQLCDWLINEFGYRAGQSFINAIVESIVTHVYIEWIHPFGDGNGRTGRLLEYYILLRAGVPDIASHILSNFYNATKSEYYRHFEVARQSSDLTEFISYAVLGFRDGLLETFKTIHSSTFLTAWQGYIHDRFAERAYRKKNVFKRQRRLMLDLPISESLTAAEILDVSPQVTRAYANLSRITLQRDLGTLIEMNLLRREQDRYIANSNLLGFQRRLKDVARSGVDK